MIVVASILVGFRRAADRPILGKLDDSFDRGVHVYEIWVERDGEEIRLLQTRRLPLRAHLPRGATRQRHLSAGGWCLRAGGVWSAAP